MRLTSGLVLRESSSATAHVRIVALGYGAGSMLLPHRHEDPYVSALIHGEYTEVCAGNPRRCVVGTAIAHDSHEEHADYFPADGVCVNIYREDRSPGSERALASALAAHPQRAWRDAFDLIEGLMGRAFDDAAPVVPVSPPWLERLLWEFDWTSTASLKVAAECGGVHPGHLARGFRSYLGITASAYRRRARIIAASTRLLTTSASLAEIAAETGFYDQSDFTNRFLEASGLPPGRFRSLFRR